MQLCFVESSKRGADPRVVERVCKEWYNAMRYIKSAPLVDLAGIPYTTKLNDIFMEDCMRRYREGLVFRATLFYKRGQEDEERKIRFSDFKDGTADLSECGDEASKQVYTTSRERFFEVGGANENKLVTFIGSRHLVEDLLPTRSHAAVHIVFLWRWGSSSDTSKVDCLATSNIEEVSSKNVFENWRGVITAYARDDENLDLFHVCF